MSKGTVLIGVTEQEASNRTVDEARVIPLSIGAQRLFIDLLLDPPTPPTALAQACEAHQRLIGESSSDCRPSLS